MIDWSEYDSYALDSNFFIYALDSTSLFFSACDSFFKDLPSSKLKVVASVITLTEVCTKPFTRKDLKIAKEVREFINGDGRIIVQEVTPVIAMRAAELRARHPFLKLPDAIHLVTAHYHKVEAFVTADQRLQSVQVGDLKVILLSNDDLLKKVALAGE